MLLKYVQSYDALKKYVYQLEKQQVGLRDAYHDLEANESTSLMGGTDSSLTDAQFIPLLDRELKKICLFYELQVKEVLEDADELQRLVEKQEENGPDGEHHFMDDDDDDDDDDDEDDFHVQSPSLTNDGTLPRSPVLSTGRRRRSRSESGGPLSGMYQLCLSSYGVPYDAQRQLVARSPVFHQRIADDTVYPPVTTTAIWKPALHRLRQTIPRTLAHSQHPVPDEVQARVGLPCAPHVP